MVHVLLAAEIQRSVGCGVRDYVLGGAVLAEMVQRGKGADDVVGFVEAGRDRRTEADMSRRGAEHCEQRRRLEAAQEGRVIVWVYDELVGDEQQVEPSSLGDPSDLLEYRQIGVVGGGP